MSGTTKRRYFHTFDALRFFAFFKVFLLHLPIAVFPWFNYLKAGGGIGVQFFFVLSGFLITYIILEEQQHSGSFDLKNFFMRRILRIWPLYYLMVLVAFSMPILTEQVLHIKPSGAGYEPEWWKSLLFLENYKMMATGEHPNVSPLGVMWSLCIEEHFYILWGLLLYFFRQRALPFIIVLSIITGIVSRIIYAQAGIPALDILTNIDLFAYGAIPAYLLAKQKDGLEQKLLSINIGYKRWYAMLVIGAVVVFSQYTKDAHGFIWMTAVLGALFAILILFTLPQHTRFRIGDKNMLSKLGIYTYGLYMYHTLVINLLLQVFPRIGWDIDQPLWAIVLVIVSLVATVLISMASYLLFETQFLKLKKFFRK